MDNGMMDEDTNVTKYNTTQRPAQLSQVFNVNHRSRVIGSDAAMLLV